MLYIIIFILILIILYQVNKKEIVIKDRIVYRYKECKDKQDEVIEQDIDNSSIELSDREALLKTKRELNLSRVDKNGVTIVWSVDANNTNDEYIKLIAMLSKNSLFDTKVFKFKISKSKSEDKDMENVVVKKLTSDFIKFNNESLDEVTSNLYLPEIGTDGSRIIWQSSDPNIITNKGVVIRPSFNQDEKKVTLKAIISKDEEVVEKEFSITVLPDESEIREIQ
jgi:hypothetical protein